MTAGSMRRSCCGTTTARRDGEVLMKERFGWFAATDWSARPGEPMRIATQSATCGLRAVLVRALDAAGIAWTEVFVGGGVATIGAAVSAGLAVAALARRCAPPGTIDVGAEAIAAGVAAAGRRAALARDAKRDRATALRNFAAAFRATSAK